MLSFYWQLVSTKAQLLWLETRQLGKNRGILKPGWTFVETNKAVKLSQTPMTLAPSKLGKRILLGITADQVIFGITLSLNSQKNIVSSRAV